MTFKIRRSGHIVMRLGDVEGTKRLFTDLVGFTEGGNGQRNMHFLTADFDANHHMVLARPAIPGPASRPDARHQIGMVSASFELNDSDDLAALEQRFRENNVAIDRSEDNGAVKSVSAFDPDGNLYEFYARGPGTDATAPFCRTSHLTLRVRGLERSRRFYERALRFHVIDNDESGRVFMAADRDAADPLLILEQAANPDAPGPQVEPDPFLGMEHFAFELAEDDFSMLQAFYRNLVDMGAEIHHTIDHRVSMSIYFLDPDRNMIEVYINCPRERYADHMDHPYASFESLDAELSGEKV